MADGEKNTETTVWEDLVGTAGEMIERLKELVSEGIVRKIVVKNDSGEEIMKFPLIAGLASIVLLPIYTAIGGALTFLAGCTISVEKEAPADSGKPEE